MEWVAYGLIGIFTGFTAAIMSESEEMLTHLIRNQTDNIIGNDSD